MNVAGSFYEVHVACNPTIVPPIELDSGHGIDAPDIAHFHDQIVLAVLQYRSSLEVETGKSAFVISQLLTVEVNRSLVVHSPEVDEDAFSNLFAINESPLVPDCPFVEHQRLTLRIPVAGNVDHRRSIEAVLHKVSLVLRLGVAEKS